MKKNKLGYYFVKEFFKNYLTILFAFGLIIWITQAVRLLDLISEDGNSISTFFLYILSAFPKIISRISIIIFFISVVVTISKFDDHNELKAMWFSGLDRKEFINYLFKFSILFVFFLILIRLFIVPYFSNYSRNLLLNSSVGSIAPLIKHNNFNSPLKKITIYVEKKNQINEFDNIILFVNNEGNSRTIIAKSGILINENNKNLLVLVDGSIQEKNNNKKISILDFDKITLDLNQYNKKTNEYFKPNEMLSSELYKRFSNKNDMLRPSVLSEINQRIIMPLFIPSLLILACFYISTNNKFINKKFFKIVNFTIGILIILIGEILLNLSFKNITYNAILVTAPFLILIINWSILNNFIKSENKKC